MYGGITASGAKVFQAVVGTGKGGFGGDEDGVLGGGMDGGRRRIQMGRRRRHTKLGEDNTANITLWTESNDPIAYAKGLEHHHQIMGMLGDPGGGL